MFKRIFMAMLVLTFISACGTPNNNNNDQTPGQDNNAPINDNMDQNDNNGDLNRNRDMNNNDDNLNREQMDDDGDLIPDELDPNEDDGLFDNDNNDNNNNNNNR